MRTVEDVEENRLKVIQIMNLNKDALRRANITNPLLLQELLNVVIEFYAPAVQTLDIEREIREEYETNKEE
jgi:hypothetical protein